jgi:Excalibur calcium-binding domain/Protein of unknown function (DUF1524)
VNVARGRLALAVALALACVATPEVAKAASSKPARGTALAAVSRLVVKGRAPMTGYSRDEFGSGWVDVNHNGCDTRDDLLHLDLHSLTLRAGTHGCVVTSGRLIDPYTATSISYVRGGGASVDIDHVVALGDAWQMGAAHWSAGKRVAFANDPLNLLAVSASANRQKGDADAASWLPPNKGFRCAYVARQLAVKLKYGLSATSAERDAIRGVLNGCPTMRLPAPGSSPTVSDTTGPTTTKPAATTPTTGGRVFANCTAARAAGVTPILRGTPLYNANQKLDRDKDGVACE